MSQYGSMFDELTKLCALKMNFVGGELKLARMNADRARESLERMESLKDLRGGELARGAALGAVAMPVIGATGRAISGAKRPSSLARQVAADALTGATFSGAIPFVRNRLERTVEREKLKDYVEKGRSKSLRRKIKRSVGV